MSGIDLNPKIGAATVTIPVHTDLANALKHWTDGERTIGDVTAVIDIGLGILSAALDPLKALVGAAVGTLMDILAKNISWLKEIVDALLGNPEGIFEHAQKWQKISEEFVTVANQHVETANQLPGWTGEASDTYTEVLVNVNENFKAGAGAASKMADWVSTAGAAVGMFREIIWGLIKEAVTEFVIEAILAAAAAIPTLGAAIAAFTAWFGARMAMLAANVTRKLAKLMNFLVKMARGMGLSGDGFRDAATALTKVSSKLDDVAAAHRAAGAAGKIPTKVPGSDVTGKNANEQIDTYKDNNKQVIKPYDKSQTKGTNEYGNNPEDNIQDIDRRSSTPATSDQPPGPRPPGGNAGTLPQVEPRPDVKDTPTRPVPMPDHQGAARPVPMPEYEGWSTPVPMPEAQTGGAPAPTDWDDLRHEQSYADRGNDDVWDGLGRQGATHGDSDESTIRT